MTTEPDERQECIMERDEDGVTRLFPEGKSEEPSTPGSAVFTHGVWCCERMHLCTWQCFALHQGLAWGTVPKKHDAITNDWRTWHDRQCGGRLIQLLPPNAAGERLPAKNV